MSIRPSISNYGHEAEKEASGQASGVCLDKTTPRMTWVQSENLGVMHDARAIKSRGNGRSGLLLLWKNGKEMESEAEVETGRNRTCVI